MRNNITIFLLLFFTLINLKAQTNFSEKWEDFFSYVNVKEFHKSGDIIRVIVDNSAFTYNTSTEEVAKLSSVNGLYGGTTSAMHYSVNNSVFVIAYEDGVFELLLNDGTVKKYVDISISNVSTFKSINSISEFDNKIYLSMQFGIVVFDLIKNEFVDTLFIGDNSTDVFINDLLVEGGYIYAASDQGVYIADITTNLNDFQNWNLNFSGNFEQLEVFNNEVLVSIGNKINKIVDRTSLELKLTASEDIVHFNTDQVHLIVGTENSATIFNSSYNSLHNVDLTSSDINSVYVEGEIIYLGTKEKGLLLTDFTALDTFIEIHPKGPNSNDIFSLEINDDHLWLVYGGYDDSNFNIQNRKLGVTHFDGDNWVHIPSTARDLVDILIDPTNSNRVYIGSFWNGLLIVEDDEIVDVLNTASGGLTSFAGSGSVTLVTSSKFDSAGDLWLATPWGKNNELLNRVVDNSAVQKINFSSILESGAGETRTYDIVVDKNDNIWMATKGEGVLVTNGKEGEDLKIAKIGETEAQGALPSKRVNSIAVDQTNNIWIGTNNGLVRFTEGDNVFTEFEGPEPIIITEKGANEKLLGDSRINSILVDGANNKWFGTATGGVLQTNSTGRETLASFNTSNSPLPSNFIKKIKIDDSTGKVFFLTDKGMVAYNSEIAAYGEELTKVYGYPNPALKHHDKVSIVGKDGANIPNGTNVKILDVSGNLVFESNTIEGQSQFGGKIVWDKKNLSGTPVASGVYIVLLFNAEGNQTSTTKIAIIN
ncbi:type IX secretion system anionic LPS delivery protein PorZ [Flavicella sediminum]|uniref:type IX secretion system anionic LPS delivery protein PorZ n=1 Tax=Flavicella sediminum TaxID=2585141 RepID=UPI00111E3AE1|nr:two-component regulator propeller domain-containing protein [Flavicella sediminum]